MRIYPSDMGVAGWGAMGCLCPGLCLGELVSVCCVPMGAICKEHSQWKTTPWVSDTLDFGRPKSPGGSCLAQRTGQGCLTRSKGNFNLPCLSRSFPCMVPATIPYILHFPENTGPLSTWPPSHHTVLPLLQGGHNLASDPIPYKAGIAPPPNISRPEFPETPDPPPTSLP